MSCLGVRGRPITASAATQPLGVSNDSTKQVKARSAEGKFFFWQRHSAFVDDVETGTGDQEPRSLMASRVVSSERTRVPREGCRRTTKTTYDETRASCKARDQLADPAKCA